jgi:hypothetical protein
MEPEPFDIFLGMSPKPYRYECFETDSHDLWLHLGVEPDEHTSIDKALNPFRTRRWRNACGCCQRLVRQPAILLEKPHKMTIDSVESRL